MPIRLTSSAAAVALVSALGFAAPAGASPTGFGAGAGKLLPGARTASSVDFAGYESSSSSPTAISVTTTIVVPAVNKCGTARKVVIPFVSASAGSGDFAAVGLDIHCRNSKVIYFPIFDVNGTNTARAQAHAHPGDRVVVRMSWNSARLVLAVVDKTRPSVTRKLTGLGDSSFSDPAIGASNIDRQVPVPDFGKVNFSNSKINGRALGAAPSLERFNLVNSSHTLQIKTGPIASNKESFTTTFKHSEAKGVAHSFSTPGRSGRPRRVRRSR